jgi:hypothetical protein
MPCAVASASNDRCVALEDERAPAWVKLTRPKALAIARSPVVRELAAGPNGAPHLMVRRLIGAWDLVAGDLVRWIEVRIVLAVDMSTLALDSTFL